MTGQKNGKRYISADEGKVLHLKRAGWASCCAQGRFMCWRASEKITQF